MVRIRFDSFCFQVSRLAYFVRAVQVLETGDAYRASWTTAEADVGRMAPTKAAKDYAEQQQSQNAEDDWFIWV